MQAVSYLLHLFENSYVQKCIFAKDFVRIFNITSVILKISMFDLVFCFCFCFFYLVLTIPVKKYLLLLLTCVINVLFIFSAVQSKPDQESLQFT